METLEKNISRTETGQLKAHLKPTAKLAKTHQDYWPSRLRKRSYVAPNGLEMEIPTWQVRLFHLNKEGWFNLDTANKAEAAVKARNIYVFLKANGWDDALAKFKPSSTAAPRNNVTVGEYLTAIRNTGALRLRTFLNYQNCLRTIVSEAFGVKLKTPNSRFDYRSGGNKEWRLKIDRIRLARVIPARVEKWKSKRLRKAGNSPVDVAATKRTVNSYLRCARSLFSEDLRSKLKGVHLPATLPFDGVRLFDAGSVKYVSKIDAQAIVAAAKLELKPNDTEAYKVFLLGLFPGMRRGEIDLAEWSMVNWRNSVIRLQETEWLHLKTKDSASEIPLDEEVVAELKSLMPASKSRFIVSSAVVWKNGTKQKTRTRRPRNDSARAYYRCDPVFQRLNEWLRSKGITANKPLHELRKEMGALITTKLGIYAASRFLRHSDITTTARHYADHKGRISAGLGKLLETEPTIVKAEGKN